MNSGFATSSAGELYYEYCGDLTRTPLVCVHGGPGFTSYTLAPLFQLTELLPVVCYDQAGCGRARRAGGRKVFSIEGFIDELEALRCALNIERMHLMGHSFGGLIVAEYTLLHPSRVASTIFCSASLDIPRWIADGQRLLSQLPLRERMILREGIRTGAVRSPAFLQALQLYYDKHINRTSELPERFLRSIAESDTETYEVVWGPNELLVSGVVRNYSVAHRLCELRCPTLFMCGRFDEATPEAHSDFAALVPGSLLHIFEQSAHNPLITEETELLRVVHEFLSACIE